MGILTDNKTDQLPELGLILNSFGLAPQLQTINIQNSCDHTLTLQNHSDTQIRWSTMPSNI